jgi:uncharacterized protein (TIGR00288 family)
MQQRAETRIMAVFCDFENIALGVRETKKDTRFDIGTVLERLLLKGNIVVKKAYCDWARYNEYKATMHEASFELIEIPHVRQSGKNSADIRMVVDALDLCYTKEHVDTFVIISGDSDFSPLVSKLRENNKGVIGVGVKNSTSDLLIANCDEFIYYDDIIKPAPGGSGTGSSRRKAATKRAKPVDTTKVAGAEAEESSTPAGDRKAQAVELVMETFEALLQERDAEDRIWGSMIKQTLKRRKPGFAESYYGFRSFGELLEEVAAQGLVQLEHDEKSGGSIVHRAVSAARKRR